VDHEWIVRPIRLRYRLGPFTLGRLPLPFAVLDRHWSRLGPEAAALRPPLASLPREVVGGLITGCPLEAPIPRVTIEAEAIRYAPYATPRYFIDLSGTFEAYLARFSSKTRATLKKKVRRFAERSGGQVRWREFRRPEEMVEFHRLARLVAEKTYQEQLLQAALPASPQYRDEMVRLAAADRARGYLLFLDDRPVAYLYCPIQDGAVLYEYLGYDPAEREASPGTVLQYVVLERLFAEGAHHVFDFTEGPGQHKETFSTGQVLTADLYYFRRSARGLALVGSHAALGEATRGAGAILDRLRLRERMRKYLRGRHSR
jgi:CelD/BcsL family acetyltransferase involved in cellulose biosynthesis